MAFHPGAHGVQQDGRVWGLSCTMCPPPVCCPKAILGEVQICLCLQTALGDYLSCPGGAFPIPLHLAWCKADLGPPACGISHHPAMLYPQKGSATGADPTGLVAPP